MSAQDLVEVVLVDEGQDSGITGAGSDVLPPASESLTGLPDVEAAMIGASVVRLYGFSLEDRPLVTDIPSLSGEVVVARSAVPLVRAQIGASLVAIFENGDRTRPIIVGALRESAPHEAVQNVPANTAIVRTDDNRLILSAEQEIVLRCGDATISLTRAGKVIIKGRYIVSRSSGHNRIKGATVDIN